MPRRILNNPRTSNTGRVDEYPEIDIRVLKKVGLLSGAIQEFSYPGHPMGETRISKKSNQELGIITEQRMQIVQLTVRTTQFDGRRWYFRDAQGTRCEKLYYAGVWLSRKAARLTYASQAKGAAVSLFFRRRAKLDSLLAGSLLKGPARGKRREQLLSQRADLQDVIDFVEGCYAGQVIASGANRTLRKNTSLERSQRAMELIIGDGKLLSPGVLARLDPILNSAYETDSNCIDSTWQLTPPTKELNRRVRLGTLLKIGLSQPGKLKGIQIRGWPNDWFEPATKLFVLIDSRGTSPRVIFVTEIRQRLRVRPGTSNRITKFSEHEAD